MHIHFSLMISFVLLGILFCIKRQIKQTEGMKSNKKLILIGDSIFQNKNYVDKGESIEDILQDKAFVLAKDNAKIVDIYSQINKINEDQNIKTNIIVVSAGGNDLDYLYKDLGNIDSLETIFTNYKKLIMDIDKKTKPQIVLSTIYYPTNKEYKPYWPVLEMWNKEVMKFAKENNFKIFHLHKYITKPNHFIEKIEPSKKGGKIIADNLLKL